MGQLDFPTWYGVGSYGGLACCLLAAGGIATYALIRHRGAPRQLARAILVCLAAGCLILPPIWWDQNRLDLYGPALGLGEVLLWLVWCALAGWLVPLGTLAGYLALAAPQLVAPSLPGRRGPIYGVPLAALDDPARMREPLGQRVPWGRLVPLDGDATGQPIPLTRQLTLLGRELDNDIVVDDERTSRHHVELHWDHGHVHLLDRRSMNGTLVNRQTVRGMLPLASGDVIELGTQRYRIEILPSGPLARYLASTSEVETAKLPGALAERAPALLPVLTLVLHGGSLPGATTARWELREDVTTIGREATRDICLPHESVSRQHAQIVRQRAGYFLSDLHSRNGTFLNSQPLTEPRLLHSGDLLRVGEVELRCELLDATGLAATEADATAVHLIMSRPPTSALDAGAIPESHDDHSGQEHDGHSDHSGHDQPTISLVPRDLPATAEARETL
jgi:pSer/pThr/pTyr-binding forkhead associated (FHA) protein